MIEPHEGMDFLGGLFIFSIGFPAGTGYLVDKLDNYIDGVRKRYKDNKIRRKIEAGESPFVEGQSCFRFLKDCIDYDYF